MTFKEWLTEKHPPLERWEVWAFQVYTIAVYELAGWVFQHFKFHH